MQQFDATGEVLMLCKHTRDQLLPPMLAPSRHQGEQLGLLSHSTTKNFLHAVCASQAYGTASPVAQQGQPALCLS
jgi:hypothetical protein